MGRTEVTEMVMVSQLPLVLEEETTLAEAMREEVVVEPL